MRTLPACLRLGQHVCEDVSWRRLPESDSEASSEDPDLMLHGSYLMLDIVDGTVNVTKCIAEVRGSISTALFQEPFCLKDSNEPCHRAKLVTNWKCQNADLARPITGYESD